MDSILAPIVILLIGIILLVIEMFVPSGGVIAVLATICFFAAVVMAFLVNLQTGFIFLLVSGVIIPVSLAVMIKIWPFTPIGRRMFGRLPTADEVLPDGDHYRELHELVGKRGVAKTKMLPSGSIRVDGKTYDAVSNGLAVDEGQKVEVVAIRTNHIVVRPITTIAFEPENTDSILSQSPESLGLESLEIDTLGVEQPDEGRQ